MVDSTRRDILRNASQLTAVAIGASMVTSASTDCSEHPTWDEETAYTGGDIVSWNGAFWEAQWWTRASEPAASTNEWVNIGECAGDGDDGDDGGDGGDDGSGDDDCYPEWVDTETYTGGDRVNWDGFNWEAQWWTRGTEPAASTNEWVNIGECAGDGDDGDDGGDGGDDDGDNGTGDALPWGQQSVAPFQGAWPDNEPMIDDDVIGTPVDHVNLAFIGDPTDDGGVTPAWLKECDGGCQAISLTEYLDEIENIQNDGIDVGLSIGGWNGETLAGSAGSAEELKEAYDEMLDTLGVTHIDIDDENDSHSRPDSVYQRRNEALALLQAERADVTVGYTVPAGTDGIENRDYARGRDYVQDAFDAGVALEYVNIMTMHFGQDTTPSLIKSAAEGTVDWLGQVSSKSEQERWNMLGITPAIEGDGFSLQDAEDIAEWAETKGVGMLSFWAMYQNDAESYASTFAIGL